MPINANANGILTGTFNVPTNIPVGTKEVVFTGQGGTVGRATYVGRGTIQTNEMRRVFTTTVQRFNVIQQNFGGGGGDGGGADPLAQTFTLRQSRHLTAVGFKITTVGDTTRPIVAQIRETSLGIPTGTVMAEGILTGDMIADGWVKATLRAPVFLAADVEYAVVLMTDDADHSVALATIGEFDQDKGWMTAQPYQTGVMLSSSNARTWTPHQKQDLTFRLYGARFTETKRTIDLGAFPVTDMTDLIVFAAIEEPAADTAVVVKVTRANGEIFETLPGRTVSFNEKLNEDITIAIELHGTDVHSPVLFPLVELIQGAQADTGDYIGRAIPAGTDSRVIVTVDCLLTGTADLSVKFGEDGNWTNVPVDAGKTVPLGDGWAERVFILDDFDLAEGRVKLDLSGTPRHRPIVRKLRAVVTPSGI